MSILLSPFLLAQLAVSGIPAPQPLPIEPQSIVLTTQDTLNVHKPLQADAPIKRLPSEHSQQQKLSVEVASENTSNLSLESSPQISSASKPLIENLNQKPPLLSGIETSLSEPDESLQSPMPSVEAETTIAAKQTKDVQKTIQPSVEDATATIKLRSTPEKLISTAPPSQTEQSLERSAPQLLAQLPGEVLKVPETAAPKTPVEEPKENPFTQKTVDQRIFLEALTSTASKYPWIVNPSDGLSFDFSTFRPNRLSTYTKGDFRFADENPIVKQLGFGHFPQKKQFYWLLDDNRIVIETEGFQGGVIYQGKTTELTFSQTATYNATFLGNQFIVTLPPVFADLVGEAEVGNGITSVQSSAVQVVNPPGVPAGEITINQNVDDNAPNVRILDLSAGGRGVNGSGSFFTNLEAINTPQVLQGFPTVNLQPLLTGSTRGLQVGSVILPGALEAAGIQFGDPLTGEGFEFNAPITSTPGIKLAQGPRDDQETSFERLHEDLLRLAIDPSLTPEEKDFRYLNSLQWTPIFRPADVELTQEGSEEHDWYRGYLSKSHQRTLLQYDPEKIQATYTNIFANPGVSLTSSVDRDIDVNQSVNATTGMLLGGVFELVNIGKLDNSLQAAHDQHAQKKGFTPLKTKATSAQRRQLNLRLNESLNNAAQASVLEQVSGSLTFPSTIKPDRSLLFQLRTGNYKRRVEFTEVETTDFVEGNTVFSRVDISSQKFGPLGFVGGIIPLTETAITPVNEAFAVETILTDSTGQQFVQRFDSTDQTVVPLSSGRAFGLAIDKLDLTRTDERTINQNFFVGHLSLPAIELVTAGTLGKFNYGVSVGTWFNFAPNTAPGIQNNTDGVQEPGIGAYTHATLNRVDSKVIVNDKKQPVAVITQTPFVDINWNSAANRLNSAYLTAGYSFRYVGRGIGFVVVPAVSYIPSGINNFAGAQSNGEILGFFNGELGIENGVTIKTNLEIGKDIFYDFEVSRNLSQQVSIGAYVRNSTTVNSGLESRIDDMNYGGIFKYQSDRWLVSAQMGFGNSGLDSSVNIGLNF